MKFNKVASAVMFSIGMVAFGANAADQGSGVVNFTGSIIDAPCSINPDSVEQTVELGAISKTVLENSGKSNPTSFKIKLENCALTAPVADAAANTVTITFDGLSADSAGELLQIDGDASGAGVAIQDPTGKTIKLGNASSAISLVDASTNILDLRAYLQGLGTETDIKEGQFTATSRFTMDYQ